MDETVMTPAIAAWLHALVARQVIEVGHPDAKTQAAMAWAALAALETITNPPAPHPEAPYPAGVNPDQPTTLVRTRTP